LHSVLAQSCSDFQAIVFDDAGPEPEAADMVRALRDPRVTYFRQPKNLGLAGNWNACLDAATTDLVTLLHADDELRPNYADLMMRSAIANPTATAFFCQADVIGPDSRPVFSLPDRVKRFLIPSVRETVYIRGERGLAQLLMGNFIMCPTLCFRKSRLMETRFAPRWRMVLDLDLYARLLLAGETLVGLPEVAYAYRRHSANMTSQLTASLVRFEEEIALYDELRQTCATRKWHRAASIARRKAIIKLNLGYCTLQDVAHGRLAGAWGKVDLLNNLLTCTSFATEIASRWSVVQN
jgi:glycosyltransferase involved in cell wall biosynthesis